MKGLIKTNIIIAVLIAISFITGIIISNNLSNRVAATNDHGLEEGRIQGYEAGFSEGSKVGYQEGAKAGYTESKGKEVSTLEGGFYLAYNPTFDEVRATLDESNETSAIALHGYAEARGMRTAYVRCQIARMTTERMVYLYHLVGFETTDRGFVVIRPRTHEEVKVEVGQSYSELNGFPPPAYDDTITKITIAW